MTHTPRRIKNVDGGDSRDVIEFGVVVRVLENLSCTKMKLVLVVSFKPEVLVKITVKELFTRNF